MKKAVIICLFFLLGGKSADCATTYFPPLQPLRGMNEAPSYNRNSQGSADSFATPSALDYPNIMKLERSLFGRTFAQNNTQNRIERLEEQLFGAVQNGDIKSRYEAIQLAANAVRQNNYYYSNTKNNSLRGLAANIGSALLGGSMTGFTPQINPFYNNYSYNNVYANPNRYNYANPSMRAYANPNTMPYSNPYTTNAYPSNYGISQGITTRGPGYSYYNGTSNVGTGMGVTILD